MARKILVFDPHLCTGCMHCMTTCTTYHEGRTSLSKARLQVIRHEGHAITKIDEADELVFTVIGCQQCEDPICSLVCPVAAISRNHTTGAMVIDQDKCVGCRMCLMTCYFGAISFNQEANKVYKCELCAGDPQCVQFCQPRALRFLPVDQANLPKKMATSKKIIDGLIDQKLQ